MYAYIYRVDEVACEDVAVEEPRVRVEVVSALCVCV